MRPFPNAVLAACAVLAVAVPELALAATDPLRDPVVRAVRESFAIERLSLFDKLAPRARAAACTDSASAGLVWCTSATTYETAEGGTYSRTFGYNLDSDGRIVYLILARREFPLAREKFDDTIKALGARYGRAATMLTFQGKTAEGDEVHSVVAYWGGIKLVRLNAAEMRVAAVHGTLGRGHLVDHRQDIRRSARQGDPVYKIEGTAGFVAEFRAVTDLRCDFVMRAVYQPAFAAAPDREPEPKVAAPRKFRELPLDPRLAFALDKLRAEQERIAAIERARRAEAERRAAEERARREEAERKAAEARRIAAEKRAAEERARRAEEERKAAEARRIAEEKRAAEERVRRAEEERKAAERKIAEERAAAERTRAEEKAAVERRIAEEKARREAAERAAAEEKARREASEKRAAEARRLAEEKARREEAERKAAEAKRLAEERARLEAAERKAAEERRLIEERVRKAEAEYRASLERARRAEAERRAAEERARQAEAERKAAEERARRVEAERKAAEERRAEERRQADRRAAEERARRVEAERKAAEERRTAEERRAAEQRRAVEERRAADARKAAAEQQAAAERRAADQRRAAEEEKSAARKEEPKPAEEKRVADARPPDAAPPDAPAKPSAEPRTGTRPPQYAGAEPGAAAPAAPSPEAGREEWLRFAIAQSRNSPAAWIFERVRDRISDDILLRTRAIFSGDGRGDGRSALEIAFECNIGAGKRLAAHVRAFDGRTNAAIPLPVEDGRSGVVRGGVTIDENAPQTAFLFPERGERQASIVEIPLGHDDIRKNTPRARAWLRHYRVVLKVRAGKGDVTAAIYPYADNLRRVLEACVP